MNKDSLNNHAENITAHCVAQAVYVGERACAAEREEWRSVHVSIMMTYLCVGVYLSNTQDIVQAAVLAISYLQLQPWSKRPT